MTTFPLLQDIQRSSIDVQFVDEHRIFGVSHGLDPDSPQLVTLLDTSTSAENPQEPREIVFELGNLEGPVSLIEGTHAQGAKLGPSFRTNPKKHVLGIACTPISQQHRSFVINYESLCTIASENESSSHIPWDFWKHKTTQIGHYTGFSPSLTLVGPRAFVMGEDNSQGPQLWCFDFTPGAYRSTKRLDPSSEVAPPPCDPLRDAAGLASGMVQVEVDRLGGYGLVFLRKLAGQSQPAAPFSFVGYCFLVYPG